MNRPPENISETHGSDRNFAGDPASGRDTAPRTGGSDARPPSPAWPSHDPKPTFPEPSNTHRGLLCLEQSDEDADMETSFGKRITEIDDHVNWVRSFARRMCVVASREPDREDLMGAALLGLAESMTRFNPKREAAFRSFARHRIVGAVKDEMRRQDHLNRRQRIMLRKVERHLEDRGADRPDREALERAAVKAGIAKGKVSQIRGAFERRRPASFDENTAPVSCCEELPDEACHTLRMKQLVRRNLARLPERNQDVMKKLYFEDLSTVEVARKLKISQPRVSQIRGESLRMLREWMAPVALAA